jgi:DNA-binding Lrp family transcriptional regulator
MDAIDQEIIARLREDSRRSFYAIGREVGLSASAVKRRVDRLVDQGIIRSFTIVVDPAPGEHVVEAFVELFCRGRTNPAAIIAAVSELPQVMAAYTVSGRADAILRLRTRDISELEGTIERIRAHRDTERTNSVIVLSRLIER